jgi:hypothetical protein
VFWSFYPIGAPGERAIVGKDAKLLEKRGLEIADCRLQIADLKSQWLFRICTLQSTIRNQVNPRQAGGVGS